MIKKLAVVGLLLFSGSSYSSHSELAREAHTFLTTGLRQMHESRQKPNYFFSYQHNKIVDYADELKASGDKYYLGFLGAIFDESLKATSIELSYFFARSAYLHQLRLDQNSYIVNLFQLIEFSATRLSALGSPPSDRSWEIRMVNALFLALWEKYSEHEEIARIRARLDQIVAHLDNNTEILEKSIVIAETVEEFDSRCEDHLLAPSSKTIQ